MPSPRPYQEEQIKAARPLMGKHRAIIIQAPTGTGKTPISSEITKLANAKNNRVWLVTPRLQIGDQASKTLIKWGVKHGRIDAGHNESRAFMNHVISKDTLLRRLDKIKIPPDLIQWDEAHIALEQQRKVFEKFPDAKWIGYTATPERTDGRGLSKNTGGIYDDIVMGRPISWFIQGGYLANYKYYAPPLEGLEELHKQGTDYKADEFDALLKRKRIYGQAIEHYGDLANGKPAIGYCRDVKSAYETTERFAKYWKAFCIEGKMPVGKRMAMVDAFNAGKIDMLFNCEIATYGVDLPRAQVGIQLRYTASRALQWQILGRIIRPFPGKEFAIHIDHVNNWEEFIDARYPNILPYDVPDIEWNFYGIEKRKWSKKEYDRALTFCVKCFMPTTALYKCEHCGAELKQRKPQKLELVDTKLQEIERTKLKDLPLAEKRETQDKISSLRETFQTEYAQGRINPGAVGEMIALAEKLGNHIMWVYREFTHGDISVNVPLLHEIRRQKGWKPGWVHHQRLKLIAEMENEKRKIRNYEEAGLFG